MVITFHSLWSGELKEKKKKTFYDMKMEMGGKKKRCRVIRLPFSLFFLSCTRISFPFIYFFPCDEDAAVEEDKRGRAVCVGCFNSRKLREG